MLSKVLHEQIWNVNNPQLRTEWVDSHVGTMYGSLNNAKIQRMKILVLTTILVHHRNRFNGFSNEVKLHPWPVNNNALSKTPGSERYFPWLPLLLP